MASARKAFHNVEKKVGSLTGASVVSQLPRNTKQVNNVKNMKAKSMGNIREDPLFWSLNSMEMEDDDERFHQQFIKTAGTATHLLFNRRQVNDIKNFCTDFGKSSVLSVDVTFNLGPILGGSDNIPEPDPETQRPTKPSSNDRAGSSS